MLVQAAQTLQWRLFRNCKSCLRRRTYKGGKALANIYATKQTSLSSLWCRRRSDISQQSNHTNFSWSWVMILVNVIIINDGRGCGFTSASRHSKFCSLHLPTLSVYCGWNTGGEETTTDAWLRRRPTNCATRDVSSPSKATAFAHGGMARWYEDNYESQILMALGLLNL